MTNAPLDPVTERAQARVGMVLRGKWRLERLIGVGGMAAVYAATHRNKMRGAVKMLHTELSGSGDLRTRFLREGYVANNVEHPGVVRVLDDDEAEDGSVFVVMELLEGQTVEARAASRPTQRLEAGEVLAIADDLLDVLAVAHERGVVHRDLKPENLFVTQRGELKVLDFGIARLREASGGHTVAFTATATAMGTPAFMPPEQALGDWHLVDARTDLWAVGATMYTLLTGRIVHQRETVQQMLLAAMTQPAAPVATVAPGLPPPVCAIIDRALAFERDHRWADARAMQRAVREVRAGIAAAAAPPAPAAAPSTAWIQARRADPVSIATPPAATGTPTAPLAPLVPGQATAAPVTSSYPGHAGMAAPSQASRRTSLWIAVAAAGTVAALVTAVVLGRGHGASVATSTPDQASGAATVAAAAEPVPTLAPLPTAAPTTADAPPAPAASSATAPAESARPAVGRPMGAAPHKPAAPAPTAPTPSTTPSPTPTPKPLDRW